VPRKSRGRPQDLVRPLELGVLLAQRGQPGAFVAGQQIVAFAGVGLGLADPAAQGLVMDTDLLGHTADHGLRLRGAVHPHRTLTQLQRVLPRRRHQQGSSR